MIKLYRIPLSTNVERVGLALAHKGLSVESVVIDPEDRSEVRRVSGQELVPVIDDDGTIIADSMTIVAHLDRKYPDPPIYPSEPARRAEVEIFVDWFNRVWKRPPNEIELEMGKPEPDRARIDRLGRAMASALDTFENLLTGRRYLLGEFSAADIAAYPFVRYALHHPEDDPYLFHKILVDFQPLGSNHPNVTSWIRLMDERPKV